MNSSPSKWHVANPTTTAKPQHGSEAIRKVFPYLGHDVFPARRDELISTAIAAGAPDDVLELLGRVDAQEHFTYRYLSQALATQVDQRL
jgi:hypothetical protein